MIVTNISGRFLFAGFNRNSLSNSELMVVNERVSC